MTLFEKAIWGNWFFNTKQGMMTIQDVVQLPLKTTANNKASLENLAQSIFETIDSSSKKSFVDDVSAVDVELTERLDLLKQVIAVKKAQNAARLDSQARAAERQQLLEIQAQRKQAAVNELSDDAIAARLKELG